ncbi:luciferase-like monooxygenase [Promicromonospora sp. AC04]|uniref:LLM class flavin-dependent oxidoreductase n=1 Tax=Promicromonospora sp. AC04 TaxID=2135723 RepID=UPI000D3C727D|nr:LLM class flavin-dependent oxidoreductase [Promicromonospora sp. AC04]PUB27665.1 luciferase-like monooxygenase [Promicromonospora sp. AC04]
MVDYGHDLLFGSFVTPRSDAIAELIHAAQEAERVGLDLVTVQDHPYHPGFVDTPTLIGQLAARTEQIRFSANVTNLPLRPPAVLAKATASLDLMTGGRIALGLGAGGYWDAISAYGGTRLTPGQSVDALSEAIDIIRALWDVTDRSMVNHQGEHYQIVGAKRGPAPAHPVPIWVGGYKPRMLRLIGAKADGWLLSMWGNDIKAIGDGNQRIDDAAHAAGRDPSAIRRLVNIPARASATSEGLLAGPPRTWVDQLAGLTLEHGFSGFILAGDDTSLYDVIGQEVAPAVRTIVTAERPPSAPRD